jgi:hypothetical protein
MLAGTRGAIRNESKAAAAVLADMVTTCVMLSTIPVWRWLPAKENTRILPIRRNYRETIGNALLLR